AAAGSAPDGEHELLGGQDLRSAELERAGQLVALGAERERERDVLYPDRLGGETAVPEHGNHGQRVVQPCERPDGGVLWAVDEGRSEDDVRQRRVTDQLLGLPLGPVIGRRSRL